MKALSSTAIPRRVLHPLTQQHCLFKGLVHDNTLARFSPADGSMDLFLPVEKVKPEIEFFSSCYEGEKTCFCIGIKGFDDGESEATVKDLLPKNKFSIIAEDLSEFPAWETAFALKSLLDLGFKYKGPCDSMAIDTTPTKEEDFMMSFWPQDALKREVGLCPNCLVFRIGSLAKPHASYCAIGREKPWEQSST